MYKPLFGCHCWRNAVKVWKAIIGWESCAACLSTNTRWSNTSCAIHLLLNNFILKLKLGRKPVINSPLVYRDFAIPENTTSVLTAVYNSFLNARVFFYSCINNGLKRLRFKKSLAVFASHNCRNTQAQD